MLWVKLESHPSNSQTYALCNLSTILFPKLERAMLHAIFRYRGFLGIACIGVLLTKFREKHMQVMVLCHRDVLLKVFFI